VQLHLPVVLAERHAVVVVKRLARLARYGDLERRPAAQAVRKGAASGRRDGAAAAAAAAEQEYSSH
jgi:hypothetical protein